MEKVIKKIALLMTFCLIAVSCKFTTTNEEVGSVTFILPSAASPRNTQTDVKNNPEYPESYYVLLMYGQDTEETNSSGKAFEDIRKSGSEVKIERLTPGIYTVVIRGESNNFLYEYKEPIVINPGRNDKDIHLTKIKKAQIHFDLRDLHFSPDDTFKVSITDLRGKEVYPAQNETYKETYVFPYGLIQGKYNVTISSTKVDESYTIDNIDEYLIIKDQNLGDNAAPIVCKVIPRSKKVFYVDSSTTKTPIGNINSPFKSLSQAVDTVIRSSDLSKDDVHIIVKGEVVEEKPILVNGGARITIEGFVQDVTSETVPFTPANIIGSIVVNNATLILKNYIGTSAPLSPYEDNIKLENGELILGKSVSLDTISINGNSLIKLYNDYSPLSEKKTTVKIENIDSIQSNQKIFEKNNTSSAFTNFILEDSIYIIKEDGTIDKVKNRVKVNIAMDPIDKDYFLSYKLNNLPNTEKSIKVKEQNFVIDDLFNIGESYDFILLERIYIADGPSENKPIGAPVTIKIDKDDSKNIVNLLYVVDYHVNNSLGSDDYSGEEETPFATFEKALDTVKLAASDRNTSNYSIYLNGEVVGTNEVNIDGINSLCLTTEPTGVQPAKLNYVLNVTNTNLTLKNVTVNKVILRNGTLTLSSAPDLNQLVGLKEIYLGDEKSIINIENNPIIKNPFIVENSPALSNSVILDLSPELYTAGRRIINVPSNSKDLINNISLKNKKWRIDENGCMQVSNNVVLDFDIVPEDGRFECRITETSQSLPKSEVLSVVGQNCNLDYYLIPNKEYKIEILDKKNYGNVVATKNIKAQDGLNNVAINLDRIRYISFNGQDTNNGKSKETAFKTFEAAFNSLSSKSSRDLDNQCEIIIVSDTLQLDNRYISSIPKPLNIGNVLIDKPINLLITGPKPLDASSSESPYTASIEGNPLTTLIKVDNDNAFVEIDNLQLAITENSSSQSPDAVINDAVVNVNKGSFSLGKKSSFAYALQKNMEQSDTEPNNLEKYAFRLGATSSLILNNADIGIGDCFGTMLVENRSTNSPFVSISPDVMPDTGGPSRPPETNYKTYTMILAENYDVATYKSVLKTTTAVPITPEQQKLFDVLRQQGGKFIDDKYITPNGEIGDKVQVTYNLTNVPGDPVDSDTFIKSRQYTLQVYDEKNTPLCKNPVVLTKASGNITPCYLTPGRTYRFGIIDKEVLDSKNTPLPIALEYKTVIESSPIDINLYEVLVSHPTEYEPSLGKIKNALQNYGKVNLGTNEITDPINLIINLDCNNENPDIKNYEERDWIFGTGQDDINIARNINVTIKKHSSAKSAKILIQQSGQGLISQTNNAPNISFEDIFIESYPSDSNYKIFNITQGKWSFKNIIYTGHYGTVPQFMEITSTANVTIGGDFNIPGNSSIILKRDTSTPTPTYPVLKIGSSLTNTNQITLDIQNSDSTTITDFGVDVPKILDANTGVTLADAVLKFTLKNTGYIISDTGQIQKQQP